MAYPIVPFSMTLNNLSGHSAIASFFKCDFSYIFAAVDQVSSDTERRAVPLWWLSFLLGLEVHQKRLAAISDPLWRLTWNAPPPELLTRWCPVVDDRLPNGDIASHSHL